MPGVWPAAPPGRTSRSALAAVLTFASASDAVNLKLSGQMRVGTPVGSGQAKACGV